MTNLPIYNFTIEGNSAEGWMDDMDGFGENSTIYESVAEAEEALQDAIQFAKSNNYAKEFIDSLHISKFEAE